MSSKFFTWTKGDRRNAQEALQSGGVVPIPVECLKIKGMEYGRSAKGKNNRKPLPLPLDQQPCTTPAHSSRTSDSIALHDAAVQSATSLMAVMNDMLRSPQLSAHISSQRQSGLTPMYSRPRSHTAPSTPLVEAPSQDPAELPGSMPLVLKKPHLSLPYTTKNSSDTALQRVWEPSSFGISIIRPHSSPQEKAGMPNFAASPYSASFGLGPDSRPPTATAVSAVQRTEGNDAASTAPVERPSLSVMQPRRSVSPSFAESVVSSNAGSSMNVPRVGDALTQGDPQEIEAVLLEEIARLRASQDSHVRSLKDAHEKELACQRSYITFLEKRRGSAPHSRPEQQQQLMIDTSQSGSRTELQSVPSATTMKSFESSIEDRKRASQEIAAEVETLKRKLSLCRKAQVDAVETRRERDHFRDAAERSSRRIVQLKDIIRKAKENDRSLRNQAADLEARLLDANNERMDVLEGFHDACSQVRTANERERRLAQELDAFRRIENTACEASVGIAHFEGSLPSRLKHGRTISDASILTSTYAIESAMRRLDEAQKLVAAKDKRIKELEETASGISERTTEHSAQQSRLADLESQLEHQKQQLRSVQFDAERYSSLLHNELRRQTRRAAQASDNKQPQIEAEAFLVASEKTVRLRNRTGVASGNSTLNDTTSAPLPVETSAAAIAAALEKELDHCIKEIIMYKLDIKGYRKDLKKANAEIDALRVVSVKRPPTPDRDSLASMRSQQNEAEPCAERPDEPHPQETPPHSGDSGLGITLPRPPKTPTRRASIVATTVAALSPPLTSPQLRSKTPLNTYKKLPRPPGSSRTPSPLPSATRPRWPEQDIVRTETLRSVSESIISSYAKRDRAESGKASTEPSSEPLGSLATPSLPATQYRADVLNFATAL